MCHWLVLVDNLEFQYHQVYGVCFSLGFFFLAFRGVTLGCSLRCLAAPRRPAWATSPGETPKMQRGNFQCSIFDWSSRSCLKTHENTIITLILDFSRYVCHKTNSEKRFVYYDFASVYCLLSLLCKTMGDSCGDQQEAWRLRHALEMLPAAQYTLHWLWAMGHRRALSWHHEIIDLNLAICENLWQMTQLIGFCRASTLVRRLRYESTVYALWQYVRSLVPYTKQRDISSR